MNEYYYGVGRVRALEARMLTPAQLARMAAASSFEAAFGVLSETPYAENLPHLKHSFDFEELVELEHVSLKNLLDYLAPQNEILAALFKRYDYLNLKILLRSFFGNPTIVGKIEPIDFYSKTGTIPIEKLKLYVFEGIKEMDDKEIIEAVDDAKKIYQQIQNPQSLDLALDKHYFSGLKRVCDPSPSPLIRNLANYQIDLINLKTLIRTQELKKDKKFLEAALLKPGFIDKDILLELCDKGPQDILNRLNFTPYFPAIAAGIENFAKTNSFYLLEKLMDDFMLNQFKKAKYLSSGVEPLVGFYLAKESEIKTVRFILISKKNQIISERIKERIRINYV